MSKKLLKIFCLSIALVMVLSLAACGGNADKGANAPAEEKKTEEKKTEEPKKADGKVKLRIAAQYADDDTKIPFDYFKDALAKEMPNVEVELEIQGQDDDQKMKTLAATGNLPDIFRAQLNLINILKESNNILVLDEYANKTGFKAKMVDKAMNCFIHPDGHVYSFPYAGNEYLTLFYNKELFEKNGLKVPATVDEFANVAKVFNSKGIVPLSIFAKEKWPCIGLYDIFATRLDPEGIKKLDEGRAKASDEAYKKAAETVVSLVKAGLIQKGATNNNYDQARALFYEGKAAMFINGQWEIADSTKALGDKVDYMYYPAYDAGGYEKAKYAFSGSGGLNGFAVSAKTKDKELAAKVAAFMATKYAECRYIKRGNPLSPIKLDGLKPESDFPPMMQKMLKDVPNMSTSAFDWYLSNPKFKVALEDACQNLLTGSYGADQFVKDMDKAIEEANKK